MEESKEQRGSSKKESRVLVRSRRVKEVGLFWREKGTKEEARVEEGRVRSVTAKEEILVKTSSPQS